MRSRIFLPALQLFIAAVCYSQAPHIAGTVTISVKKGFMAADLEVSNYPQLAPHYGILLNAGLNLRSIRDGADTIGYYYDRYFNNKVSDEGFLYYIPSSRRKSRFLPPTFRISYVGAFPVYTDTLKAARTGDWKGNIAFNANYLRATEQTAWYPILYDTLNDIKYNCVTYDLKIICEEGNGKSIYMNGSPPANGPVANFKSNMPVKLFLFAGNYEFEKKDNTYFINAGLNGKQEQVLSAWANKITVFYEKNLKIPYGYQVTYLQAEPVTMDEAWSFVTYPTIANISRDKYAYKQYFDPTTQNLKDSSHITTFSHELGHYYFGTYFVPNAELSWFFGEGCTEYVSLQTVKELLGENYYKKTIKKYVDRVKDATIIPLNALTKLNADNVYRYSYAPLLLTALEKTVGQEKMWKWLNVVLNSKNQKSNYEFFRSTLLSSGVTQQELDAFEKEYIKAEDAKQNVIKKASE